MPDPPLVSVVTPVYNGAAYLAECIESVLGQTYDRFEYVISDNRSTDDSLAIAQSYAERDDRLRVVAHEEHLTHHLESWNRSMRLIADDASYVKVVHADDWLFDDCLARMVALSEEHPSVGLVGAYRLDEDRVNLDGVPARTTVLPGRDVARAALLGRPWPYLFGSPTSTMVRADLVRKRERFYYEVNIHADSEVCLDVLSESDFGFPPISAHSNVGARSSCRRRSTTASSSAGCSATAPSWPAGPRACGSASTATTTAPSSGSY